MSAVYFKRYRMQFDLRDVPNPGNQLDAAIWFLEWEDRLVVPHALCKWESFRREIDANVFPCLGEKEGCKQLMRDISQKENFVPEATWLACLYQARSRTPQAVGTIQGLRTNSQFGAIQNIGVVPGFRGKGIGRELIRRSLLGFRSQGCRYVNLEVTIHNLGAIRLYESIGFVKVETVFKVGNLQIA
jgi:GNAT superfamily N-acetyltransferase